MSEALRFNDERLEEIVEQYYLGDIIRLPEEEIKKLFADAEVAEGVSRSVFDALGVHQFHINKGKVCYNPFLEDDTNILHGSINRLRKETSLRRQLVRVFARERVILIRQSNRKTFLIIALLLPYLLIGITVICFLLDLIGA